MIIPDNAEELATIAHEIGAQVIRGPLSYPGRDGSFDVGEVDLEELLYELKGQEVIIIIAPLGPVEELPTICGLCGARYEGGECPACKKARELAKRLLEEQLLREREEKDRLIRDIEEWLEEQGE